MFVRWNDLRISLQLKQNLNGANWIKEIIILTIRWVWPWNACSLITRLNALVLMTCSSHIRRSNKSRNMLFTACLLYRFGVTSQHLSKKYLKTCLIKKKKELERQNTVYCKVSFCFPSFTYRSVLRCFGSWTFSYFFIFLLFPTSSEREV